MNLFDLVDRNVYEWSVAEGLIKVQTHPTEDLLIHNYTDKATYARHWNSATRICRGLITDTDYNVVARPFPKFFNLGEHTDDEIEALKDEPVTVFEKMDGSLGVLYMTEDGELSIATRGSFTSEQALHATELLRRKYATSRSALSAACLNGCTYLFEIIYPENRIVLDYGDTDDLVLLATIDNETGRTLHPAMYACYWSGPIVERHSFSSLAEVIEAPERMDAEGYVVHFGYSDLRMKIKHEEYIRLHRIFTGCTARTVWEYMAVSDLYHFGRDEKEAAQDLHMDQRRVGQIFTALRANNGQWRSALLVSTPEEFEQWVETTAKEIDKKFLAWPSEVMDMWKKLDLWDLTRKEAAAKIIASTNDTSMRGALFMLLDKRILNALAWLACYPGHEVPFKTKSEDVA